VRKLVDQSALVGCQMLQDFPLRILILIIFVFAFFIVVFLIFFTTTNHVLTASKTLSVETTFSMVTVLVVSFFIVDGGTVMRAAVETGPILAADIAERATALTSDVIACLSQLYSRATDKALLITFLIGCLPELFLVLGLFALMVLGTVYEQGFAFCASQLTAFFRIADGIGNLGLLVLHVRFGV
jgi:hypothetical protein